MMTQPPSAANLYQTYLQNRCSHLSPAEFHASFAPFLNQISGFDSSEPETAIELNNFGVIALIEAEQANDLAMRELYFQTALEAFEMGSELGGYPLCTAHLAIMAGMLGDRSLAGQRTHEGLIYSFVQQSTSSSSEPLGLVYLPQKTGLGVVETGEILQAAYHATNALEQASLILATALSDANQFFYVSNGLRILHFLGHLAPQSSITKVRLGIASLYQNQVEGLHYLHQAYQLNSNQISLIQVLFLACLDLGSRDVANHWLTRAQQQASHADSEPLECYWLNQQASNLSLTYIPFDGFLLAVEASLKSIVTAVVLAEGDWFEDELRFWRQQLQPGMVAIDVGANVGIYAFSAAKRVGKTGKVFAVEPFSACVQRLEETRRVNQFDWVEICAGAASNHTGKARLGLDEASELNQIITDEADPNIEFEEVQCFTLDEMITKEPVTRVDWLKIDAEGHEIQVLEGSRALLNQFQPNILYENVATNDTNLPVAEFLIKEGYILHTYQPYFNHLIPLESLDELKGKLNIIAIHQSRIEDFAS